MFYVVSVQNYIAFFGLLDYYRELHCVSAVAVLFACVSIRLSHFLTLGNSMTKQFSHHHLFFSWNIMLNF